MKLKLLHQQILINRRLLAQLYENLSIAKFNKRFADEAGEFEDECHWHNQLVNLRKHIKRLVTLQCALKTEIQTQLRMQRQANVVLQSMAAWKGIYG